MILDAELMSYLEQNPYANIGPVVGKVMIVCPVSLINVSTGSYILVRYSQNAVQNWKSEFHKWYHSCWSLYQNNIDNTLEQAWP